MPRRWNEAILTKRKKIGSNTKHLTLRVDVELNDFSPGQFITMDLPIGEKRLDRWRSYSISGINPEGNELDLSIVKLPEGKASTYLTEGIQLGEDILFKGPEGQFTLPDNLNQTIVMICTGTGVAPFRAMIRSLIDQKKSPKKIHLIFGTRTDKDILYREEFEGYSEKYLWFEYSVILSRQEMGGQQGYVHKLYKDRYSNNETNITFMLCGWSMMVDEARDILIHKMGFHTQQVISELYG